MTRNIVYYNSQDSPYASNEKHGIGHSFDLVDTLRSLKVEVRICKVDNGRIM